jgi:hypothetical protein
MLCPRVRALALTSLLALLPACGDQESTDINFEDSLASANGLTSNGLTSNGLTSNGLTSNGLTSNGLTSNGLTSNGLVISALRDRTPTGALSRMFFHYMVSCALPAGKSVSYTWTNTAGTTITEVNPGQLGLAAAWADGPLSETGKQWVSACLAARTNSLGHNHAISMRAGGTSALPVSAQERTDFSYGEGSFWGNLFDGNPYIYSCTRSPMKAGATTSAGLNDGRTCTTSACGVIKPVGYCYLSTSANSGQNCWQKASNNDYASDCGSSTQKSNSQNRSDNVISVWLKP